MKLDDLIQRWKGASGAERANKDAFLIDLCAWLGVPHPDPTTGDRTRDRYVFEADALTPHEGGLLSVGKMDLYKDGCFVLEAKQGSDPGAAKVGSARRSTPAWNIAMRDAFGQALGYARTLAQPPPFLIVADLGFCFDLYATFDGTHDYRPFPDAARSRLFVTELDTHRDLLRAVWSDPHSLDPARQKARVTRRIAAHVARLAADLEVAGHAPERVAKFLMRCLFSMFAEDVGLLPPAVFTDAVRGHWIPNPERFVPEVTALWRTMETGGSMFGVGRVLRFNGGLFADADAIPLSRAQLEVLAAAAECDWTDVEPAIFGTLLERALDPRERHQLGAHYTPRAFVQRLVKPTLEDPLREEWDTVRVQAREAVRNDRLDEARAVVGTFHARLCQIRVLDPACGTGNFLYVALDLFKRLEDEVIQLLVQLGDTSHTFGRTVTPAQFLGIERKPWARQIADLVLWIGQLSWSARMGGVANVKEPVLEKLDNIACRDAVLSWDGEEEVLDASGAPVTRWDGVSMKVHPVTGKEVPDEQRRVPVRRLSNARQAEWPEAEFIIGNPPYIGAGLMRQALGDGYVEALRAAWPDVPDSVDLVMYWWDLAARTVRDGRSRRFGFITTKAITQTFNRRVVEAHLSASDGLSIVYAVPNHPWPGDAGSAAVRVAMTVAAAGAHEGTLETVKEEREGPDGVPVVTVDRRQGIVHADLKVGPNIAAAGPLRANGGLTCPGVKLHGAGFLVTDAEAALLGLGRVPGLDKHIVPYCNGRDLAQRSRGLRVIDLFGLTQAEVAERFPKVYQWVLERVKPERDQNARATRRDNWWIFGEPVRAWREMRVGLPRYISTIETAKHRWFVFLEAAVLPDNMLTNVASMDAALLAILSSRVHVVWALAAGGRLGVGNDPRYNKSRCFDPFPFPTPTPAQTAHLRDLGERLDAHRKSRQALHPDLTLTGMYNVLEKLRAGTPLDAKERVIHDHGLVAVLRKIHDEIDAAVAAAYGWPGDLDDEQILTRLVQLNAERAEEERQGLVRWLRPELQAPTESAGRAIAQPDVEVAARKDEAADDRAPWPKTFPERIAAVRGAVERAPVALDVEAVARRFAGARRAEVDTILASLAALGLVLALDTPTGRRFRAVRGAV